MRIEVPLRELNKKISAISSVVPAKTTMPILSTVLISAEDGEVRFSATDLDISVTSGVEGTVGDSGRIAAPAKKTAEIVRSLSGENVTLDSDNQHLTIQCGKSRFTVNGRDPEDFPRFPEQKEKAAFRVDPEILNRLIDKTGYAVSRDLTRPAMGGVLWEVSSRGLNMVSTDGHRLARVEVDQELGEMEKMSVIVPPKALTMLKSYTGDEKKVEINVGENNIRFSTGQTTIFSRLLEGPYPNYEKVIPGQNDKEVVVNRELLDEATRRVAILSDTLTHQVVFSLQQDKIILKVSSQELGEAKEEVEANYSSEPMDLAYNAAYLGDILKSMDSEEILLLLDRPDNAGVIKPCEEAGEMRQMCIIMPLRIT